ncbi:DUF692 family protein [Altererythrobacter salegens]|uniref:DUF692 family protein n=1 Tax=Croceibacterium salegens TaxID=1737568 RepID=A0A6I4T1E2_9SPHN|nr:DUF692 domain-containing protein [Croceibacterium salegens]MXO61288.1 DUF692 family protein [Croceibacterium salegens]
MDPTAGLAFKPEHFDEALAASAVGLWFEVHAENYMVPGGPRLAMLSALREARPLSLHGVGLSLGGHERPDVEHLAALVRLVDRFDPFLVSEHLAWSRVGTRCMPDLLPVPRTFEALECVCRNIDIVQHALGRQVLIENPAHYLPIEADWCEPDFLAAIVGRTGCGLLIDVNNVAVAAYNLGLDAGAYLMALPHWAIAEIHIAGHTQDPDPAIDLLIDSHDAPVGECVWDLLDILLDLTGPRPVLLERDGNVPPFSELMAERDRAAATLANKELVDA